MQTQVFASKIDGWLIVLALAATAFVVGSLVFSHQAAREKWIAGSIAGLSLLVFLWWPMLWTRYTVGDGELAIRSGVFSWRLALDSIEQIEKTRDMASSPALSLDRLRIVYVRDGQRQSIMISPSDQAGFLAALPARKYP